MKDLFTALSKYKVHDKLNPEENYCTEAFAFILKKDKRLASKLFNTILNDRIKLSPNYLSILTQVYQGKDSVIDLLIKDNKNLIFIEIKLRSKIIEYGAEDQIEKYLKILNKTNYKNKFLVVLTYEGDKEKIDKTKYSNIFNIDNLVLESWENIYKFLSENKKNDEIIKMFLNYMGYKGMAIFNGFNKSYFTSLRYAEDDFTFNEEFVLKKYFEEFTNSICNKINSKDLNTDWRQYIYPMDKSSKKIANHFYFTKDNKLNLNINTEVNENGLLTRIWLPLWKSKYTIEKQGVGKIDQTELRNRLFAYKNKIDELSKIFYDLFISIELTFYCSLSIKQYFHKKTKEGSKKKKAQGMQKGHYAEIIRVNKGSQLIFSKKNISLLSDYENNKEIFDNLSNETKYFDINEEQIKTVFQYIFNKSMLSFLNQANPKLALVFEKHLPIEFIESSEDQIIDRIVEIILQLKKIIIKLNNL